MTDDLIERLARDLRPVRPVAAGRRLLLGLGAGALVSALLTHVTLGWRPDMAAAMGERMFWLKIGYSGLIVALALWACERLVRAGEGGRRRAAWLLLPVLAVFALAAWQLMGAPSELRRAMIMGGSSRMCPVYVLVFSLPPLVGLLWAVRGLAPTRLRLTGWMLGLAAGGAGATAYALHCDEPTAPFLAIWYSLGILAASLVGGLLGPRFLRW